MGTAPHPHSLADVVMDQEERMNDLRAALAALDIIASASHGIDRDEMIGLRFVVKQARELTEALCGTWRDAARRERSEGSSEAKTGS